MRHPRPRRLLALLLAGAAFLGACGGDDDADADDATAPTDTASGAGSEATGGGADGAADTAAEEPIDDATVAEAATGVRGFFERVEISDQLFREMAARACAVVAGPEATAEQRAQAIVDDIPDGPDHPHYVPAMILFSQLYLSQRDCGTDPETALATREALLPLQNAATHDAIDG